MAIFHAEFFSKCLMRLVDVDICLPIEDLVEPQPQEGPFPTLYLLHGYTGRSEDWLHGSCIAELSRQYGIAVVMPSGENSFYEDDTEAGFLYSTFVGQELVELTRAAFPLCRDREHTWMAGLSMGGFGTLLNACKFSETFSAAACFSSAFIIQDIAGMKPGAVIPSGVGNYGYYRRVFGDLDALAGGSRDQGGAAVMEKTIKKPVEEKPTVGKADRRINAILSVVLGVLCVAWIYPIVMIFFNSLKTERAITTSRAFELPTAGTFVGLKNYIYGIQEMDFLSSFWYSLVITVSSVVLILLCCSMCAWFITRVNGKLSKLMYGLCMFSMVVPFQMVMFTLAKTADTLKLNNPYNICIIYLGFGAGLAVFMFTGFMKSMPVEIEEAAMIDGCNPLQIFFRVVCPILKPTMISTAILETMWVWNDYLLPTLVLDIKTYRTIPMAIQYFRGSYGKVEMAPMMACIMITILPVIILYLICQKYIIDGVVAGAVKG